MTQPLEYITVPAGTPAAQCKGCPRTVYWVTLPSKKKAPINCAYDLHCKAPTADTAGWGINHFIDCPKSATFKKSGRMRPGSPS